MVKGSVWKLLCEVRRETWSNRVLDSNWIGLDEICTPSAMNTDWTVVSFLSLSKQPITPRQI